MVVTPLPKNVQAVDVPPERLAGDTALTEQQKIAEASRQFEAILLRQILSATQKTVIPSKYVDNSTTADIYRDMVTNQLADSISKSGAFGLAKTFEQQLTRHNPAAEPGRPSSSANPQPQGGSTTPAPGAHGASLQHRVPARRAAAGLPVFSGTPPAAVPAPTAPHEPNLAGQPFEHP